MAKFAKFSGFSLYPHQVEYIDKLADTMKLHKKSRPNRSAAIQQIIEDHMKGRAQKNGDAHSGRS